MNKKKCRANNPIIIPPFPSFLQTVSDGSYLSNGYMSPNSYMSPTNGYMSPTNGYSTGYTNSMDFSSPKSMGSLSEHELRMLRITKGRSMPNVVGHKVKRTTSERVRIKKSQVSLGVVR